MKRKKPQSTDSHLYDRRALDYFKAVTPEHWKFIPVGDEDSQIEYGQDRIVQLTDENNQLDGAEFRIQNKGTKRKITKHGIGIPIAVSTLNYLRDVPLYVLLHFYHLPSKRGYWIWLDDVFSQSDPGEWQEQDEVTVYAPTTNILDAEAVEQIKQRIFSLCRIQAVIKHAHSQNLIDPHYTWDVEIRGNGISINQKPKHPDAPPIMIDLSVSDELRALLVEAWETGISVQFDGQLPVQGLPDWVKQIFEGGEIEFVRNPSDRVLYREFRFYKQTKDKKPFYTTGPIEMKFIHQGSKVARLEGLGPDGITKFGFTVDFRNEQRKGKRIKVDGGMYLTPDRSVTDVVRLDECYSFIEQLMNAEKVIFYDPLNRMRLPLEHPPTDMEVPAIERIFRNLVQALAVIHRELHVAIPAPELYNEAEFGKVQFVRHVIQTGRSPHLLLTRNGDDPYPQHLHLLAKVETNEGIENVLACTSITNEQHIFQGVPEFEVEVFGYQLQLGPTQHVMQVVKCLNANDLCENLKSTDVLGKTLDIFLEVDWETSYTKFPKFSKE